MHIETESSYEQSLDNNREEKKSHSLSTSGIQRKDRMKEDNEKMERWKITSKYSSK